MLTAEIDPNSASSTFGDDVEYEFTSARVLRGTEARTIAKWERDGWEFDSQETGTLRTEITFRRRRAKNAWQQCVAFLAAHVPAFGRLTSTTQQVALAAAGAVAVIAVVLGIVLAGGAGSSPATPAASTDATAPSEQPAEAPSQAPAPAESAAPAYAYQGVPYEIVVIDEDVSAAKLTRYWVLTAPFDYSTDAYKSQIGAIIEDIARRAGTTDVMVDVVTDREIAEAEAFSTYEAFVEKYGADYFLNTIPQKEKTHYVASYTGGFDRDNLQASTADAAYEILWHPAGNEELQNWKPTIAG
ncbi:hypothetical protein [Blastococcus sp. LR1]|uniref:hypothetical protein n=1 Tax=Blastococcus sp. LR1 TaxID=2877000 RepID=UPI001CCEAA26|nr:hypothetical protein [Blastococcus sp. LR1]MCA0146752.1 hypothetical protein [Blastococcus sp. LR1]